MLIFDQLKKSDPQLRLLMLVVLGGMCVLLAGLWWVQIVSSRDYQANLETQSSRTVRLPAVRGKILDRNRNVLAESQPCYSVCLYFDELRDQFHREYIRMRPMKALTNSPVAWKRWLGLGSSTIKTQYVRLNKDAGNALTMQARYQVASNIVQLVGQRLQQPLALDFDKFKKDYANSRPIPCPIARNISPAQIARFEEQFVNPIGVDLDVQSFRCYPHQTTAAHLLGHLRYDDRSIEGEEAFFSYRLPDYSGVVGIETGYEKELHGRAGVKSVLVNNLGYRQTESIWSQAEPGRNVVLTIDLNIQKAAEQALQSAPVAEKPPRGAVVVMDVDSGDVLALASSPTFDPNFFVDRRSFPADYYQGVQAVNAEKNRATMENYAPGSIFKTIVGLACLEAGLDPKATVHNPGFIYVGNDRKKDTAPPGDYDFRRAIMFSSNTYFITNGMKAGVERIVRLAQRLHLGERIGLPTRQETAGNFPSWERIHSGWSGGDTANLCIGQGCIDVTPLQMAVMTAALANGGTVLWPRLVDRIESPDPTSDDPPTVFPKRRVRDQLGVKPRNLRILQEAMRDEVEDAGTGARAVVPGLQICGKTGTAQVQDEHNRLTGYNFWFASYAPFEKPRYAVVILVQAPPGSGSGGVVCAPLAAKIYTALLENERKAVLTNNSLARIN